MPVQTYSASYNSFSGVDMHIFASGVLIGEAQGLSYTVTREKAPNYTMGSADPRGFSRGKRGIAGSMIFMVFDRSALMSTLRSLDVAQYVANQYEVNTAQQRIVDPNVTPDTVLGPNATPITPALTIGTRTFATGGLNAINKVIATARYHDQILPFDILLIATNEYGHSAKMQICNAEIMNSGSGSSVDDINTDESCTYVATSIVPWHGQRYVNPKTGVFSNLEDSGVIAGYNQGAYPSAGSAG